MDNPFPPGSEEWKYVERILDNPPPTAPPEDGGTGPLGPSGPSGPQPPTTPPQGPPSGPPGYTPREVPPPPQTPPPPPLLTFPGIGDILARIKAGVGDAAGAAFAGVTGVLEGIAATTRHLIENALPTIGELAIGTARAALSGLDFIADNLTDAADLGLSLAEGFAAPLSAILEAGGAMFWEGIARLLTLLAGAMRRAVAAIFDGVPMERPI